jgi:hypothetical protein
LASPPAKRLGSVANVFGRDEAGSELTLMQKNVDDLLQQW